MGKKIVIKLIRFYQLVLSPYKGRSYCNYVPSCSQYAVEAIDMYGVVLGGWSYSFDWNHAGAKKQ